MTPELIMFKKSKEHIEEYYRYWLNMSKEDLIEYIKMYRSSWLEDLKTQFDCLHKREWLKKAYKERFVKNIFDTIYLFFL